MAIHEFVPAASYEAIFDKYGIEEKFRGPDHYRIEAYENEDGTDQLVPVPTEILIEDDVYLLTDSGGAVSKYAIREDEAVTSLEIGPRSIIQSGAYVDGTVNIGEGTTVEKGTTIINSYIGNLVHIHVSAKIIGSTIMGKNPNMFWVGDYPDPQPVVEIGAASTIEDSSLSYGACVGDWSKVENAQIGDNVQIGNRVLVEGSRNILKKTKIEKDSVLMDGVRIKARRRVAQGTMVLPYGSKLVRSRRGNL